MKLEQIAFYLNFQLKDGVYVRTFSGYDVSLVMHKVLSTSVKIPKVIFVLNKTIDKQDMKMIRKATKIIGMMKRSVVLKNNAILFGIGFKDKEKFELYMKKMVSILTELRYKQLDFCPYCKEPETDSTRIFRGAKVYVHEKCVKDFIDHAAAQIETLENPVISLIKSICFAVIGGFVGLIPSIILLYTTELNSLWLYVFIPLTAFYGYKKGSAHLGLFALLFVAIVSFIYALGFMAFAYYSYISFYHMTIAEGFADTDLKDEFIRDMVLSFVFTFLVVLFSWLKIFRQKNNRKFKRIVKELKRN